MSIIIKYTPEFLRLYTELENTLKEEVRDKIILFKEPKNHKSIKVHKLHGKLKGRYSFSVNYKFRILFEYAENKKVVTFKTIGDHDIYK